MPHIMPIHGVIETRGGKRMALARTRYIAWKYYRRFFLRDFLPFPSPPPLRDIFFVHLVSCMFEMK